MADTAAGILLDTIHDWGIDVIFGLPGDGINGIMEALRKRQDTIRFVQVRHEEAAAFMACGYARFTNRLGACLATSGPGGIHLVSGLYDAKVDNLPVVALTGHHYHDVIGTHTQQDVDLSKLFADVALYSERVMGPAHAENVAHVACRAALGFGGVAHINMPADIQDEKAERRSPENVPHHQSAVPPRRETVPPEAELRLAADVLNAGQRVALLIGDDARPGKDDLLRLSDALAAPIVAELLGRPVVPDEDPCSAGCLGLLGTRAARQVIEQCDTLFLLGSRFPYSESAPLGEGTRVVQLAADPARLGLRYAIDVGLVGDTGPTLQALAPLLRRHDNRDFLGLGQQGVRERQEGRSHDGNGALGPQRLAHELAQRITYDTIVSVDPIPWRDGHGLEVGPAASGLPYAIAAQVAFPQRPCVALVGQHSFTMLMAEFATAVKYKLPVRVVLLQDPEGPAGRVDFAAFAQACGGTGFSVGGAAECGGVLDQAFRVDGPALVQARLAAQA